MKETKKHIKKRVTEAALLKRDNFKKFLHDSGCHIQMFAFMDEDVFYLPDGERHKINGFVDVDDYVMECMNTYYDWREKRNG